MSLSSFLHRRVSVPTCRYMPTTHDGHMMIQAIELDEIIWVLLLGWSVVNGEQILALASSRTLRPLDGDACEDVRDCFS